MNRKLHPRSGFTLIELLVVVVVIAILMGLLFAAFGPIRNSTLNFAITSEINELEGAVDQFKTKFGFYPPCEFDFDGDGTSNLATDPEDLATFKQYLRKVAPNHEETDAQIILWWNGATNPVGQNLDNDSILVFWLSGLNRSAQYPLTYALGTDTMYGTIDDVFTGFAVGDDPAKHIFFEFNAAQLVDGNFPTVKRYLQRKVGEQPYLYFDAQRYAIAAITIGVTPTYPYLDLDHKTSAAPPAYNPPTSPTTYNVAYHEWFNPTTFQIVAAGVDSDFGARGTAPVDPLNWMSPPQYKFHRNNLTNFTGGVLEKHLQ